MLGTPCHVPRADGARPVQPQIVEDFRALRQVAEDMQLFRTNHLFFLLLLAHILVLEAAAWLTLTYFGTGWIPTLLTAFILTTSQVRQRTLALPRARCPGLRPCPSPPRPRPAGSNMTTATCRSTRSPGGTTPCTSSSSVT